MAISTRHFERCSVLLGVMSLLICIGAHQQQNQDNNQHTVLMAPDLQTQYEWHNNELVYQYAQTSAFTLLAFNVPLHTQKAEFLIDLFDDSKDGVQRTIILSVRRGAIPVLNAFNETVPEDFVMPVGDQQTYILYTNDSRTIVHDSPLPGRVYMAASVLNPLSAVVEYLQWGEKLSQSSFLLDVRAVYTTWPVVDALPADRVTSVNLTVQQPRTFSFTVPDLTTAFTITVSNCNITVNGTAKCPVTIATSETLSPESFSRRVDCQLQNSSQCVLTMQSPLVEHTHYVVIAINDSAGVDIITVDVSVESDVCQSAATISSSLNPAEASYVSVAEVLRSPETYRNAASLYAPVHVSANEMQFPSCLYLGPLGRVSVPTDQFTFSASFGSWNTQGQIVPQVLLIAPDNFMEVKTFFLQDYVDTGGILRLQASLVPNNWTGMVWVCVSSQRLPQNGSVSSTCDGGLVSLNSTTAPQVEGEAVSGRVLLPFPAVGDWYLTVQSQCLRNGAPVPCELLPMISFQVGMMQCPDQCGTFGTCQLYMVATAVFAACECFAGYRGLSCSDDRHALTRNEQLTAVYLLTLSNLAFIPTILLALYRRFYTLAAIFAFNCFFSTFYHACDTNHVYQLCIIHYDALAFSDFFGSVLSFYAVLATMCRIPEGARTFVLIIGAMVIAMLQDNDRHSDVDHVMPLVAIGVIMAISWLREMRIRRKLFPSKCRYLLYILPGIALAVLGIGINYGLMKHQSTYQFTHSFWHVSVMLSPCFLMPPRRRKGASALSISAQDIIRVESPNDPQRQQSQPRQSQQPQMAAEEEPPMFDASLNSLNSERNHLI